MIEGTFFKTYKKSNCKEETENIDLTKCNVKYDIGKEKQFILEYTYPNKKTEDFIFD